MEIRYALKTLLEKRVIFLMVAIVFAVFGTLNLRNESNLIALFFYTTSLVAFFCAFLTKKVLLDCSKKNIAVMTTLFGILIKKKLIILTPDMSLRLSKKKLNQAGNRGLSIWVDLDFIKKSAGRDNVIFFFSEKSKENQEVLVKISHDINTKLRLKVEDAR